MSLEEGIVGGSGALGIGLALSSPVTRRVYVDLNPIRMRASDLLDVA